MSELLNFTVDSPNVTYTEDEINSRYNYETVRVNQGKISPQHQVLDFKVKRNVPKTGLLLVGLGGNNGTTVVAGILANKQNLQWHTREGIQKANYYGSMLRSSTINIGYYETGEPACIPFSSVIPILNPNDIEIHGWDISNMNLAEAMDRACVLDYDLKRQLYDQMREITPWPSIYKPDFIASNQSDRANNILTGSNQQMIETIRQNIRDFKSSRNLDKVIVLWTANTERFARLTEGLNDTADNLEKSIQENSQEISPSTLFAIASIYEGCTYINGSPQNTFVPGLVELAERHNILIAGDDFKSGQTKIKSVLADFLINSGLKLRSVVSYNHLGNNDGKNLSAPETFRSKEISKSGVIADMVRANNILYQKDEEPDHCVVIKYVPYVGDSKRAMDEYTSEIFMGGRNTIVMHNTCEDSLLAAPIILDLVILAELCERIQVKKEEDTAFSHFHPVLSVLSFLLKAPQVPPGCQVVNALFAQRQCIVNLFRACVGLPPENFMMLEQKITSLMRD